jgi:5-methyltetrahydrofolate--homocysteine methyltransferase
MSALLTTTMGSMKETVEALGKAGLKGKTKVIIGGAPITQAYASEIKADGYAPDAASAVDTAKSLLPA